MAEIIELGGVKTPVDTAVLSPAIVNSLRLGKYEGARRKNLTGMIEAGDRIVDVGGGIGFTSALMARTGKPALVVSIDGHPGVRAYAERLHQLNGVRVQTRTALVVTQKTTATQPFHISGDFWGSSMLPGVKDQVETVDIPVLTFAELIDEYAPNMVVIDLEVMREYLRPEASSGPLEAMQLTGIDKVVVHLPIHLAGAAGVRRVFDFFSSQDFYYDIDHSRAAVVLFRRLAA